MVEKTLRSVLACLMAVALSVGLLPMMPRDAVAVGPATRSSEDWETFGSCEWRIDEYGCLTLRPADGAYGTIGIEGEVEFYEAVAYWPWDDIRESINSAVIVKGIVGNGSLEAMFYDCLSLTTVDAKGFDTSNVTDMRYMFLNCRSLASLDISGLDASSVTNLNRMFKDCRSLASLDLTDFDASNVTNTYYAFQNCESLEKITFGEKSASLAVALEELSALIDGADGCWYNSAGKAFKPEGIPENVADTYYASKLLVPASENSYYVTDEVTVPFFSNVAETDSTVGISWDDRWLLEDSSTYNNDLATAAMALSAATYRQDHVETALGDDGLKFESFEPYYDLDYENELKDIDQVAYSFAKKTIVVGGKEYDLLAVVVRGTPGNEEWLSNINVSDSSETAETYHEGFMKAASFLTTDLREYAQRGVDLNEARILVTGHSRGAAVANILGATLGKQYGKDHVYGYTFATPETVLKNDVLKIDATNVFNVVNPEDIVTKIPLTYWGYCRYGTDLATPSKSNTTPSGYSAYRETMQNEFTSLTNGALYEPCATGAISSNRTAETLFEIMSSVADYYDWDLVDLGDMRFYSYHYYIEALVKLMFLGDDSDWDTAFKLGLLVTAGWNLYYKPLAIQGIIADSDVVNVAPSVEHGHTPETYLAWMKSGVLRSGKNLMYTSYKVNCPVDVRVYDADDTLVAEIVDDKVNESLLDGGLAAYVDEEGGKSVDVPSDGSFRIEITATDDGEMDVSADTQDSGGESISSKRWTNVALRENDKFTCATAVEGTAEDAVLEKDGTEIEATAASQGDAEFVSVRVSAEGNGVVWGNAQVLPGENATVHAEPVGNAAFDGWYIDGNKVSGDADCKLRIDKPPEMVARFVDQNTDEPDTGPGTGDGEEEGGTPSEPSEPSNPSNPNTPVTPTDHEVALSFDAACGNVEISDEAASEGETVTVTALPLFGYEAGSVTVTDTSGKAIEVTAAGDGTWTFSMPDGDVDVAVEFAPTAWENPFSDVSEDDWFYDQVRRANLLGLMKGYDGATLFGPDDGLMREQAATVMWNLMGAGDVSRPEAPQADVDQSQWYAPYVNWAVDSKVMDGYDTGSFGVGDPLTREQFAAVVAKAVGADVDSADQGQLDAFTDADGVSGWARATMAWAVEAGVLNGVGTEDGSRELQATRTLTRAEMAAMVMNAIDEGVLKLSE